MTLENRSFSATSARARRLLRPGAMRTRRGSLLTFAFVFLFFGSFATACGGGDPGTTDGGPTSGDMSKLPVSGDGGTPGGDMMPGNMMGAVGDACTQNSDCASDLCTKISYDRKPGPVCTYMCDPNNPNPLCPMGCNPKGYCRVP